MSDPKGVSRRAVGKVKLATEAHTNLTVFHAVKVILEGGGLYGARPQGPAQRIISICEKAAHAELVALDKAMDDLAAAIEAQARGDGNAPRPE